MTEGKSALLSFYRADDARLRPLLVRGGIALTFGGALMLLTALTERLHLPLGLRIAASLTGIGLFLFALVNGFVMLPRLLSSDHWICARTDGLCLSLGPEEELFPWDDVKAIEPAASGIVVKKADGTERVIERTFGGKTPAELAKTLDDVRRKASLNLL
jgi:hypothetical protein